MKIKSFSVTSRSENNYYFTSKIPQLLLIHPVLKFIIDLEERDVRPAEWIAGLSGNEISISDKIKTTKEELTYYYNYYMFLKDNLHFGEVREIDPIERRYTAELVQNYFTSCEHILFEVTDACQLNCTYCGYGDLYEGFDKRTSKNLSIKLAKKLLDYYHGLREAKGNFTDKPITIGFYGGEPLLNFPFIVEMVNYAKNKNWQQSKLQFAMTTNGILLEKYMDFLVENEFLLIISLDGNERHNAYRVFKNGKPSFPIVYNNIKKLKGKYPDYFEKKTGFVAVGHNKNSLREVEDFFEKSFNRTPVFDSLNMVGINPQRLDEFQRIYKQKFSDLKPAEMNEYKTNPQKIFQNPYRTYIERLIDLRTNYRISNCSQLFNPDERYTVSGTCAPFSHRIFLTVNGKILHCERIPQTFYLAEVNEDKLELDFQEIAAKYNRWLGRVSKQCNACLSNQYCDQCIFHLNLEDASCKCSSFKDFDSYKADVAMDISLVEETPIMYSNKINEWESLLNKYNAKNKNK